jgi:hypothetical protein
VVLIALIQAAALCAMGEAFPAGKQAMMAIRPLEAPGLHNLFALGTNIYSGSVPEGEKGFASLSSLGVKTIITVDGAMPDVESARKQGMRYVHLPLGYDGIRRPTKLSLVKASRELDGPIYVHCHHGKHRGPAAAAVICMADGGWTPQQAEEFLIAAGTSTNYVGLYETIRTFRMPSDRELSAVAGDLPEIAEVTGLVEAMVEIDERWEHLKAIRDAGYRMPPGHPDIDPANEAVILWERYREAQRLPEASQQGDDFLRKLGQAEAEGREAQRLLQLFAERPSPEIKIELDHTFDSIKRSCVACHKAYRDRAGVRSKH